MSFAHRSLVVVSLGVWTWTSVALGQPAVPMAQGSGAVTSRADVRFALESLPGTSAARLQAIAAVLTPALPGIRQCYRTLAASHPTAVGELRVRVQLAAGARDAAWTTFHERVSDSGVKECVTRAITGLDLRSVERPAGAEMSFEFTNTAAAGSAAVTAAASSAPSVRIERDASGRASARGAMFGGTVEYVVRGADGASDDALRPLAERLGRGVPMLLDCRRRAGRRGRSPAGTVTLARGAGGLDVRSSTVADPDAGACVARALAEGAASAAVGVELELTFRP